ncbi:hypothetical protein SAMN05216466_10762 [Paraburkholderia phenazinium]|uniref:Uncharacterized protein n=1 Tax=Paraburkholderia phenazinium TaxID=60549 RepID=A0A1G7ZK89_9BURK|nr:hypothetical protein SAMN05216466_10762 [Paraburkholderia phenazinium]
MTISTYAVVENGAVTNVILWDGQSGWEPPAGTTAHPLPDGSPATIGYLFDGTSYTAPPATPKTPS